jgi:hypothetical protein
MVTRTLYVSGTEGVMAIVQAGTSSSAISNPIPYASQVYFHSALPYVQIKQRIYVGGVYFGPQERGVVTWADGSKGCKIICTKLYELGILSKEIYEADQLFGERLRETNPDIYNGYIAWAQVAVDWMNGEGPKMMPWMTDEQFSKAAKKWSVNWTQDIVMPWAEEMAYQIGAKPKGSNTGKVIMLVGNPICKAIGVWQRWVGPSKKPPGVIKGAAIISIIAIFKIIATLGKLIEGK